MSCPEPGPSSVPRDSDDADGSGEDRRGAAAQGGGEVTTLEDYLGESSAASARPGRRRPVHHDERDKRGLGVACARSLTA